MENDDNMLSLPPKRKSRRKSAGLHDRMTESEDQSVGKVAPRRGRKKLNRRFSTETVHIDQLIKSSIGKLAASVFLGDTNKKAINLLRFFVRESFGADVENKVQSQLVRITLKMRNLRFDQIYLINCD
eukprot:TRINITY_DN2477_c0_g1_i1.p1 TRINITY_DN2477_c0_g1~~TRINITY_DN2477_c0_g1_i1.p1  ORF type:complete len:128 (+),score=19.63 TRINITY_DN2477_c0_g1_i1:35-418(+)